MLTSKVKKGKATCDVPFKSDSNQYIKLEFECELKKYNGKSAANIIKEFTKTSNCDVHYFLMEDHSINPSEDAPKKGNYLLNINLLFKRESNDAKVIFEDIKREFHMLYSLIEEYILNDCKKSLEMQVCFSSRNLYKKMEILDNYVANDFMPLCNSGYRSIQENMDINISIYKEMLITYDIIGNVIFAEGIFGLYDKMVTKIVEFNKEVIVKVRG